MLRLILSPLVRVLAADAVCLEQFRGHGVFQRPDHGDGAVAFGADATPAAEELEGGR